MCKEITLMKLFFLEEIHERCYTGGLFFSEIWMLKTELKIEYSALTDVGLVREHNEDYLKVLPERGIFILADGMGGYNAGEVASEVSVNTLSEILAERKAPGVKEAFQRVNKLVHQMGEETPSFSGMGTTLITLMIREKGQAVCAHVGDSRLYRYRKGKLKQMTMDHSLANELVDLGTITSDEIEIFPYKHVLSKAIGTNSTVDPEVTEVDYQSQDIFLLSSDGLSNYATEKEIEGALRRMETLEEGAKELIEIAKKNGGGDNISVILVKIDDLPRQ